MELSSPLLATLVLGGLAQLLLVAVSLHLAGDGPAVGSVPTTTEASLPTVSVHGDAVVCPSCGTANEADYQYCENCVTELPGVDPTEAADEGGSARLAD